MYFFNNRRDSKSFLRLKAKPIKSCIRIREIPSLRMRLGGQYYSNPGRKLCCTSPRRLGLLDVLSVEMK